MGDRPPVQAGFFPPAGFQARSADFCGVPFTFSRLARRSRCFLHPIGRFVPHVAALGSHPVRLEVFDRPGDEGCDVGGRGLQRQPSQDRPACEPLAAMLAEIRDSRSWSGGPAENHSRCLQAPRRRPSCTRFVPDSSPKAACGRRRLPEAKKGRDPDWNRNPLKQEALRRPAAADGRGGQCRKKASEMIGSIMRALEWAATIHRVGGGDSNRKATKEDGPNRSESARRRGTPLFSRAFRVVYLARSGFVGQDPGL